MPEANSAPIPSNLPSRYPRIAPDPAHKPKLPDRRRETLRSPHYSPRPRFRHGLFHLTHVDLFGPENPSPLAPHLCCQQGRAWRTQSGGWTVSLLIQSV